jgi:hypothetical protein
MHKFYAMSIEGHIKLEGRGITDSSNSFIIEIRPLGDIDFMAVQKANNVLVFLSILLQNYPSIYSILDHQKAMVYRDDIKEVIAAEFKNNLTLLMNLAAQAQQAEEDRQL